MISLTFDLCSSSPYYCGYPTFFSRYIVTVIPSASMATPNIILTATENAKKRNHWVKIQDC